MLKDDPKALCEGAFEALLRGFETSINGEIVTFRIAPNAGQAPDRQACNFRIECIDAFGIRRAFTNGQKSGLWWPYKAVEQIWVQHEVMA